MRSGVIHSGSSTVLAVRFAPRGNVLATGERDGTLRGWSVDQGASTLGVAQTGDAVLEISYSPLLSMMITRGAEHLRGWRIPELGQAFEIHVGPMQGAAFLQGGKQMAVSVDGRLRQVNLVEKTISDASDITVGQLIPLPGGIVALGPDSVKSIRDGAVEEIPLPAPSRRMTISPRGDRIALCEPGLCLMDFPSGTDRHVLEPDGSCSAAVFTADSRLLVAAADDGRIHMWDTARSKVVRVLEGHQARVTSLDLMHGRALLASGSEDGTVRLWDLRQSRR